MDLYYHWNFWEGKIFSSFYYVPPVFQTSLVTQCLNSFADGSLLLRMRAYSPDSLIIVIPLGVSKLSFWQFCLSAASTCFFKAPKVSEYPNATATSLPTNHGSPEISTVLSSPNCGWLNTVGASVDVDASERWAVWETCHHYAPSSNDVYLWHTLIRHEGKMLIPFSRRARGIESTLWNTADFIRVYLSEINLCFQRNTFPAMSEK